MKAIAYTMCALLILGTSCSKNSDLTWDVAGKWNWESTSGGFIGVHDTPASTGKHIILELTPGNQFTLYTNGVQTTKGTYTIRMRDYYYGGQKRYIEFSNNMPSDFIVELTPTSLQLGDGVADGFSYRYKRISRSKGPFDR